VKHVDYAYTTGMTDEEIADRLAATTTGVLALNRAGESYAVPLSHYHEDGTLYFRLGTSEGSTLRAFVAATETACYVVYGTQPTDEARRLESWSVVVTGTLRPVSDDERFDTAEMNRRFAPVRVFDEDIAEMEVTVFELDAETATGRATPP
jgi:nitroimidazol reductase NimA-like FMN-containing flavoprotein (pyridoxamine 5'-phosphate oxidase superfamily)